MIFYIAPDGELYKLPFELLLNEKGKRLSDMYSVSYLSSGRDILRPENWNKSFEGYKSAAILADPLYKLPDDIITQAEDDNKPDEHRGIISRQSRDIHNTQEELFKPLPFAEAEAAALDRIFNGKKEKRLKIDAKKYVLEKIGSHDIIHISTHGFAFEDNKFSEEDLKPISMDIPNIRAEDPLIRCGLAFAGVQNWLESDMKKPLKEYGDGILNAKELLSLDLSNTDLLVLSACQTGLGEIKNGEGIKGLRRAFELTGVRSLICTLWSVDDLSSAILMERFYKYLLVDKMNKIQALSNAKDYVKKIETCLQLLNYYKGKRFYKRSS